MLLVFTDEMYVLSASHKRVNVQLVGKDKIEDILGRFEELPGAALSYLGVSSSGDPVQISKTLPSKIQFFFRKLVKERLTFVIDVVLRTFFIVLII